MPQSVHRYADGRRHGHFHVHLVSSSHQGVARSTYNRGVTFYESACKHADAGSNFKHRQGETMRSQSTCVKRKAAISLLTPLT
jgi:hypothetical protein